MKISGKNQVLTCFHCGNDCDRNVVMHEEHAFCCEGCRTVYDLLSQNSLCDYYDLENNPGITPKEYQKEKWAFLDEPAIARQLLQFSSEKMEVVTFFIPGMHCTSCIYLLENMHKLGWGIISSQVNFLKKEVTIKYDPKEISLRKVVELLATTGYAPNISLDTLEKKEKTKQNRSIVYKIAIAGFCFGNIMLLSLPEYFDLEGMLTGDFVTLFRSLDAILALPVIFYSGRDYFTSAWYAIRTRTINMDLPIAIGMAGLVVQSYYDVISGSGGGYFDSLTGLVFFLLVGKFFQQRTYDALSFDRDYRSYFPLAITRINGKKKEESVKVNDLKPGDTILVHNEELIPADSILENDNAQIDYSFVTGESAAIDCNKGQMIYAGGRNKGGRLQLKVIQEVSHSYLTRLWNAEAFKKERKRSLGEWSNQLARIFTVAVIVLAIGTAVYWKIHDPGVMMRAVTSVLIVACPCVLALSIPFTFGFTLRTLGRNGFYLKDAEAIESLAEADMIVFDKTGTLTHTEQTEVAYKGEALSQETRDMLAGAVSASTHPVSRSILHLLNQNEKTNYPILNWEETLGQGISVKSGDTELKLGRQSYVTGGTEAADSKATYISLNGKVKGAFELKHTYRKDIATLAQSLKQRFSLFILSGDNDKDKGYLAQYFQAENLYFNQSPQDKLSFIENLQNNGHKAIMIGDGLNDAGALKASNFGITITDDINSFTPASDAILDAKQLGRLPALARVAKSAKRIIYGSFAFSTAYNAVGLSFAMSGELQPWVAAILMPVSSISVVLYTWTSSTLAAKRNKL